MAVLATSEEFRGKSSSQELDKFHRTYTRVFLVRATRDYTEYDVINDASLPVLGTDTHPQDTDVLAISKRATLTDLSTEGCVWQVTVQYDSKENPLQTEADPLSRPVLVEAQYQQINEAVAEDLATPAVPILNSAGEPFESPLERQRALTRYTITKNYDWSTFDTEVLDVLADTCNNATWWQFKPYSCKMDGITWSQKVDQQVEYAEVKYTVVVDTVNLWHPVKVLDRGFREIVGILDDGTFDMRTILDSHGVPLTKPSLLKNGYVLPAGEPPQYLEFTLYPPVSWSLVPYPS